MCNLLITIILTTLTILLLPDLFPKYKIEIFSQIDHGNGKTNFLADVDGDGDTEVLRKTTYKDLPAFYISSPVGEQLGQVTAKGLVIPNSDLIIGDHDSNGMMEILIPYQDNDSIRLIGFEVDDDRITYNITLDQAGSYNDKSDVEVLTSGFVDINGDGYKEAIFYGMAGHTLQPRKIYAYDFVNEKLWKSPFFGSRLMDPLVTDLDEDGEIEIYPKVRNTNNYRPEELYADHYAWWVSLDSHLNFNNRPFRVVQEARRLQIPFEIKSDEENFILSVVYSNRSHEVDSVFHLVNPKGELLASRDFQIDSVTAIQHLFQLSKNEVYIALLNGEVWSIDQSLKPSYEFELANVNKLAVADVDNDDQPEYIVDNKDESITVYRNEGRHPATFYFPRQTYLVPKWNVGHFRGHNLFAVSSTEQYYLMTYSGNSLYFLKFPFYGAIFLGFYGLILGVRRIRDLSRTEKEKQIQDLQIQNLKNQFDTHFTFNVLNSIGKIIYDHDPEQAHALFTKFSGLIRYSLENSEKVAVPIKDEMEFCKKYLQLQQLRYKTNLEYDIDIGPGIDVNRLIPNHIIQTHIENSFKHAFKENNKTSRLRISLKMETNHKLRIQIVDNGRGFGEFNRSKTDKKGLSLMRNYFRLFEEMTGIRVKDRLQNANDDVYSGALITIDVDYSDQKSKIN